MFINGIDIDEYNARLLGRVILPSETTVNTFWGDNSLIPFIDKDVKHRYKLLQLELEFKGTPEEIEKNKSKLLKNIEISEISFKALNWRFKGYITGFNINNQVKGFETLQVNLKAIEIGDEKNIIINDGDSIILPSTAETPVILEIDPLENISKLEIVGFGENITIKNLSEGKKVIIDGEKGLVTEEGENKFQDYDSWGFPKLSPGENKIDINNNNVEVIVKYSPRWL